MIERTAQILNRDCKALAEPMHLQKTDSGGVSGQQGGDERRTSFEGALGPFDGAQCRVSHLYFGCCAGTAVLSCWL